MESQTKPAVQEGSESRKPLRGEVVYVYAFDLAHDMKRQRLQSLLGHPAQEYSMAAGKRSPKQWFFYRPDVFLLPQVEKTTSRGLVPLALQIKVFNIGAMSLQVRIPFEVDHLEDLVPYYDLTVGEHSLDTEVRRVAEEAKKELGPFCIRPVAQLGDGESYRAFCLYEIPSGNHGSSLQAEVWLAANRRQIGSLLAQETDANQLSDQEVAESTEQYLTYCQRDLVVVDWDAALVVGQRSDLDEVLHVIELANVQLLELGVYDRSLDVSLQEAYRDLDRPRVGLRRKVTRNLREIRVDLARLSDELLNTTKFFGDWHLARVYQALSGRFHLPDWHSIIRVKLTTLGELYQLLHQDWINSWMVVLEATIVLLFVIDVVLLITRPH